MNERNRVYVRKTARFRFQFDIIFCREGHQGRLMRYTHILDFLLFVLVFHRYVCPTHTPVEYKQQKLHVNIYYNTSQLANHSIVPKSSSVLSSEGNNLYSTFVLDTFTRQMIVLIMDGQIASDKTLGPSLTLSGLHSKVGHSVELDLAICLSFGLC